MEYVYTIIPDMPPYFNKITIITKGPVIVSFFSLKYSYI